VLQCFSERWIADSESDYLLNPSGTNQIWIKFAHEMETFTGKNYLQILLPHITNQFDFNNLTPLTETVRLENFYLGYDGRTLYRKRGLCEHLLDSQLELSTCRALKTKQFEAITVEELTRLYRGKHCSGEFSIDNEKFANFWDFLYKKTFPRMQLKGELPLEVMPQLLMLIESYYDLKISGSDIKLFKAEVQKFFKILYQFELEDINFLYGVKIAYQGKEYYLLELFILINMAQSYDVDEHLKAIASWLYQFNPTLKAVNKELLPFYTELKLKAKLESHLEKGLEIRKDNLLYRVKTFLVSLFVTPFEFFPFSGKTISLWDIKNVIFSEGEEIYNQFAPFLMTNKTDALISAYDKTINEHIIPCQKNKHICKWLTHYQSTLDWYQLVEAGNLSKIDVFWFEPELLLHVLVHLRLNNKSLGERIVNFLDELIHTYAQNNNELLIQLRVNILFAKLLKSLDEPQKRNLILTLQLFDPVEAKSKFLTNCINYVTNRLCQISMHQLYSSSNFFGTYQCIDSKKLLINKADVKQVSAILEAFKEILHSLEGRCNPEQLENMLIYLRKISRPILTVAEVEEAQQSARVIDYIGAPT
ncbi:TPA: hypothetical protein JA361_12510, partial [Legionella pneumophila]|nr:hypothetical protein [Legionella pneumophila]HAT8182969.1 hypothetical protein [Legionella pneumophila]